MTLARHMPSATEILMLDNIGQDRFRARYNIDNFVGAAFGGQLLGQALAAARATVVGWPTSSMSGTFFRAGKLDRPIDYIVERVNDRRRFAFRQVKAVQGDRTIFAMHCTFHVPQEGAAHQTDDIGTVPEPESLPDLQQYAVIHRASLSPRAATIFARPFPIEMRPADPDRFLTAQERDLWFRVPTAVDVTDLADHQALLAVMSDYWLPGAITTPHNGKGINHSVTSLNHALWFHRAVHVNEWLLYRTSSHWAGDGRGLAKGLIFDRSGRLAASATQEALISALPPE